MTKNIKIKLSSPQEISSFEAKAWKPYDIEHYGKEIPFSTWEPIWFTLKVEQEDSIVGTLTGYYVAGVFYLLKIVVNQENIRSGIGKMLLEDAEEKLKELKIHKILLETGKDWEANKFYVSMGYTKTANLPQHFYKKDFVIYTKLI